MFLAESTFYPVDVVGGFDFITYALALNPDESVLSVVGAFFIYWDETYKYVVQLDEATGDIVP